MMVDEPEFEIPEQDVHGHMNYRGDVRSGFAGDRPLGPTTKNEMLWPVEVEYDPEKNMTRVAFSKFPPPAYFAQMLGRMAHH